MVTGNVGRAGGGVSHGMDEWRWFDRSVCLPHLARERREIPKPQVGRGLLGAGEPPIKIAVISGSNPVNQCPNSGLVRKGFDAVDFKVVLDMFMTDTASLADVFLPTTHFLQEQDLVGSYWHNYVMPVNVAQARLGEEKTDLEIFSLLAERLGFAARFPPEPEYYLEDLIAPLKAEGVTLEEISAEPVRPQSAVDVPFEGGRFPGPSNKFTFVSEVASVPDTDCDCPYDLLSPHPADRVHSQTTGEVAEGPPTVYLGELLAERIGVDTGDLVVVKTAQGRLECVVEVRAGIAAGTVVIYEGTWDRLGGTVNRLTSDELSDDGLCATYNDVRCGLERSDRTP
jgi:anaerobic selenocysteine-containing dehydrogenase